MMFSLLFTDREVHAFQKTEESRFSRTYGGIVANHFEEPDLRAAFVDSGDHAFLTVCEIDPEHDPSPGGNLLALPGKLGFGDGRQINLTAPPVDIGKIASRF